MVQTFHCPNCRASLEFEDPNAITVRCPYCNSTVIVPEELRRHAAKDSNATDAFTTASLQQAESVAEIFRLVQEGRKIAAIKLFRETFGVGLKEAKEAVERMERGEPLHLISVGEHDTSTSTGPTVRSCVLSLALFLLVLSGAVFFLVSQTNTASSDPVSLVREAISGEGEEPGIVIPSLPTLPPAVSPTSGFAEEVFSFGGQEGIGPGTFDDTRHIGLDGDGNIYTGDYGNGRIQVFAPDGNFMTQWTITNADAPMLAMAVNRQGVVSVIESGDIYRYEGRSGELLDTLESPGGAGFRDLATTADGRLVAYGFFPPDTLVVFDADGNETQRFPEILSSQTGDSEPGAQVAVDGLGNIHLLGETFTRMVFKYDANGKFITRIGSEGDEPGQFRATTAIAVDNQGRVYVEDFDGIDVFAGDGRYLATIPFRGVAFDMVFNDQNELFVMDRNGNRVVKYAARNSE